MSGASLFSLLVLHTLQVSLLVCLVAMVDRLLVRRRPEWVATLWLLTALKSVVPPVFASSTSLFSWVATGFRGDPAISSLASANLDNLGARSLFAWANSTTFPNWFLTTIVAIWILGALLAATFIGYRYLQLRLMTRRLQQPHNSQIQQVVADIADNLGLKTRPEIRITQTFGPAVCGLLHPQLCLPKSLLNEATPAELQPIIAHELLHLRRRDTQFGVAQLIACSLNWFNPLMWWANRRLSLAAELAVDREVAQAACCSPRDYVNSLIRVLELRTTSDRFAGAAGIMPALDLQQRVRCILQGGESKTSASNVRSCVARMLLFLSLGALVLPGQPLDIFPPRCQPGVLFQSVQDVQSSHQGVGQ